MQETPSEHPYRGWYLALIGVLIALILLFQRFTQYFS